jgi:hypothetical protein
MLFKLMSDSKEEDSKSWKNSKQEIPKAALLELKKEPSKKRETYEEEQSRKSSVINWDNNYYYSQNSSSMYDTTGKYIS